MTRKEIIDGLKFTIEMFLLDPSTGETITEPRNNMDKTTIDACKGAIELLEQTDGDLISRQAVIDIVKFECREWKGLAKTIVKGIEQLPSAEKTIQTYGWCKGCKEYDTEKHCCHRYSSFIRESLQENINAVLEDIKKTLQEMADDIGEDKGLECAIEVIEDSIEKMKGGV